MPPSFGVDESAPNSDWSEFVPPSFGTAWGPAKLPPLVNSPNSEAAFSNATTQPYTAGSLLVFMLASLSNSTTPPSHTIGGTFASMGGELIGTSTVIGPSKSARISWFAVFSPGGFTTYTPATVGGASQTLIQPYAFAAADIASSIVAGSLATAIRAGSSVGVANSEGAVAQPVVGSSRRGAHVISAVISPDSSSSTFAPDGMDGLLSTWSNTVFGTASQTSRSEAPKFGPWFMGAAGLNTLATSIVVPGSGSAAPGRFVPWLEETPKTYVRPAELRGSYYTIGNQTSLNVTFETGDHVFLFVTSTDASPTPPSHSIQSGFSLIGTTTVVDGSNSARTSVAKYIASSSTTLSLTPFGTSAADTRMGAFVVVGASAGSPTLAITSSVGGPPDPPSVATTEGALLLLYGFLYDASGGTGSVEPPSGTVDDFDWLSANRGVMGAHTTARGITSFNSPAFTPNGSTNYTFGAALSISSAYGITLHDPIEVTAGAYSLSGSPVSMRVARVVAPAAGAYALTGSPITLRAARKLVPTAGSYLLGGSSVSLLLMRRISPASGSYALTGSAVSLRAARRLIPTAGAYALTGLSLVLRAARRVIPSQGSYAVSSPGILLAAARKLAVSSGSYALSGSAVALRRGFTLSPQTGAYSLAGGSIDLRAARVLAAQAGSYALAGQDIDLRRALVLAAEEGSYALSGSPLALRRGYEMELQAGSYELDGQPLGLAASRRLELQQGSYTLAGEPLEMRLALAMLLEAGSYELTGFEVILLGGRDFSLLAGSYTLTGSDIELSAAQRVQVQAGAYELEGFPVFLSYSGGEKTLVLDPGAYLLSGSPIDLRLSRRLELGLGAFALQGSPLRLAAARVLSLGEGSYELDGFPLSWSIFTSGAAVSNMGSALVSAHNGTAQGGPHGGRAGVRPHRGSVKHRGG